MAFSGVEHKVKNIASRSAVFPAPLSPETKFILENEPASSFWKQRKFEMVTERIIEDSLLPTRRAPN
jgi:hypothetical protein